MARYYSDVQSCIDELIAETGKTITLGTPLGIGKPNTFLNALYQTVKNNPELQLHILTALSLTLPQANSDIERRFLEPFASRLFGNYPDLSYAVDRKKGCLPNNVKVTEFFLKSGEYLKNSNAQQNYLCSNYTHVARDMVIQGVNVVVQAVAMRDVNGKKEFSLSANPDVTLDLIKEFDKKNISARKIVVVNQQLPFMENDAIITEEQVDAIILDPSATHTLFSAPNMRVAQIDYLIGLYVSGLIKDGGTLQIGIGSLGDAIAHALILRQKQPEAYQQAVNALYDNQSIAPELSLFTEGLFGCSEMFVNGFMHLIEQGIIKREVFNDIGLQTLINEKKLAKQLNNQVFSVLLQAGLIDPVLTQKHLDWLLSFGVITQPVTLETNQLHINGHVYPNDMNQLQTQQALQAIRGDTLQKGCLMQGGFFLGPQDFYQKLRELSPELSAKINMTAISEINHLFKHEALSTVQRQQAYFVNTCMMMTLHGQIVSDGLDNGLVVSGVGGQYNFVAQAHELENARSIMMMRSTRTSEGNTVSNFVWSYPHCTIPRHLRDMVVTEYGIADLRGQTDSEVIKRLINIADSRFQEELLETAIKAGKVEPNYQIPYRFRNNLIEAQKTKILQLKKAGLLSDFPFGHDFTDDELAIIRILEKLKASTENPLDLAKGFLGSFFKDEDEVPVRFLERMGFNSNDDLKTKILRQLFIGNIA